jgi:hypothetical protein
MAHLTQGFSLLDREQQSEVLQMIEDECIRAGSAPPSVLEHMFRVCKKYEREPDAAQLINLAASWLETEFEMRRMAAGAGRKSRRPKSTHPNREG